VPELWGPLALLLPLLFLDAPAGLLALSRCRAESRVNAHLELLLGRAYDGALAPEHREDLAKSALSEDTIRAAFIRSVPPSMITRLLDLDLPGIRSALLFPFRSPAGGFMSHTRVKVFPSLTDRDGHTIKYLGPRGEGPRLYFPRAAMTAVLEDDRPVYLVEGVKKALAVAQVGLPAVGFEGVEAWHRKGSRELLDDFAALRLAGRVVELLPDGDVQTNPHVARGVAHLAEALRRAGALPRLVVLPAGREELAR
jgi:hypothetical protein